MKPRPITTFLCTTLLLHNLLLATPLPTHVTEELFTEASIRELANTYFNQSVSSQPASYEDDGSVPTSNSKPYVKTLAQMAEAPSVYQPQNRGEPQNSANPLNNKPACPVSEQPGYTINFANISVCELITFISKIAGTNFIFNSKDLEGITVTIVSEDPTSVSNLSSALMQILKINGFSVMEEGNNVLIYRHQNLSRVSTVITNDNPNDACDKAVITRVFQLYNVDPIKMAEIVGKMVSPEAIVEPSPETCHLVVTDITANVNRIADLLNALENGSCSKNKSGAPDIWEYAVKNADPVTLAEYARQILGPLAAGTVFSVTPEATSGSVFVVGVPFILEKAKQIMGSLDISDIAPLIAPPPESIALANNAFYMYKLKYTSGEDIAAALREIGVNLQTTNVGNVDFINAIYTIQWLDVNNSIVITGTQDAIDKVVALIDSLDKEPKQVYIEVLILDTTLTNSIDFGVQWVALGEDQNRVAFGSGLLASTTNGCMAPNLAAGARTVANNTNAAGIMGTGPQIPNPGNVNIPPLATPANLFDAVGQCATEAFSLGFIGNVIRHNGQNFLTLGALVSALDEEEDSTIVLNPKIMVEDTQPADFFVGQNIPYQTTSTVIQQTGSVTQNIQYEDIGVELQVTPTISPDNMVTLQINQAVADFNGLTAPGSANLTPVTNKTLSTTRVHVPDGTFLVMSGHVRDQCTYIWSGIPCLGTLPLIGPTFSRTIEERVKRNLVFFIRPKVVSNIQQGLDVTNQEGYDYNYWSNPCSIIDNPCCPDAPECEIYPNPCWPLTPPTPEKPPHLPEGFRTNIGEEEGTPQQHKPPVMYPYQSTYQGNTYESTVPNIYPTNVYPGNMYPGAASPQGNPPGYGGYNQSAAYPPGYGGYHQSMGQPPMGQPTGQPMGQSGAPAQGSYVPPPPSYNAVRVPLQIVPPVYKQDSYYAPYVTPLSNVPPQSPPSKSIEYPEVPKRIYPPEAGT